MTVVAAAALLTVGQGARDLCRAEDLTLIALTNLKSSLWSPRHCPLCLEGHAPTDITT